MELDADDEEIPFPTCVERCLHCRQRVLDLEEHIQNEECFTVAYYCQNCCTIFNRTEHFRLHMKICQQKTERCQFCSFEPTDQIHYSQHLYKEHLDQLPVPYKMCNHGSWCLGLRDHRSKKCIFCLRLFDSETDLLKHLFSEHQDADVTKSQLKFPCNFCKASFTAVSLLFLHHLKSGCFTRKCLKCLYTCKDNVQYSKHIKMLHNPHHIFPCPSCAQIFSSSKELAVHSKLHHNFVCDICSRRFSKPTELQCHREALNDCKKCRFCPSVVFRDAESIKSHMVKHMWCLKCKNFCSKRELLTHKHQNWTKYQCNPCTNLFFETEAALDLHRHSHHFACKLGCAKFLAGVEDFFLHNLKHHLENNLNCLHCYQPFENALSLSEHVAQMSCFYTFKICKYCQMTFHSHTDSKNHMTHSPCVFNECIFCSCKLPSSEALTLHSLQEHSQYLGMAELGCTRCNGWCTLLQLHVVAGSRRCNLCKMFYYDSLVDAMLHFYTEHRHYTFKFKVDCVYCSKTFDCNFKYYDHILDSKCVEYSK
jgi:hypothetical protein